MTAALDRAVANALGLKSVNNCEKWSRTMIEEDDDIQDYKKPWVSLTDEEIDKKYWAMPRINKPQPTQLEFARAIEQMLKEKNNG
jgi:hypothetical protein